MAACSTANASRNSRDVPSIRRAADVTAVHFSRRCTSNGVAQLARISAAGRKETLKNRVREKILLNLRVRGSQGRDDYTRKHIDRALGGESSYWLICSCISPLLTHISGFVSISMRSSTIGRPPRPGASQSLASTLRQSVNKIMKKDPRRSYALRCFCEYGPDTLEVDRNSRSINCPDSFSFLLLYCVQFVM